MQNASAADLDFIRNGVHRAQTARVELRDRQGNLRAVLDTTDPNYGQPGTPVLISGSVNCDTKRDVLRTCLLNLYDPSGQWFPVVGGAVGPDARLHIYKGYKQTSQMWPMGVFNITQPENLGMYQVQLHGADKASDANGAPGGGYLDIQVFPTGTLINTAVQQIAAYSTWGETNLKQAPSSVTLPFDRYYGHPQHTPWSAVQALVRIPDGNGNVSRRYYDETGYMVTETDPDPNTLSTVETLAPSPTGISLYLNAHKRIEDQALANTVIVLGGLPRTGAFRSVATDTTSALAVANIGTRIFRHNNGNLDPILTSQAACDSLAAYLLRTRRQWEERVPIQIGEHPLLQPWDVVKLSDPASGLNDTYQILGFTIPIVGSAEMTLDGWRVKSL